MDKYINDKMHWELEKAVNPDYDEPEPCPPAMVCVVRERLLRVEQNVPQEEKIEEAVAATPTAAAPTAVTAPRRRQRSPSSSSKKPKKPKIQKQKMFFRHKHRTWPDELLILSANDWRRIMRMAPIMYNKYGFWGCSPIELIYSDYPTEADFNKPEWNGAVQLYLSEQRKRPPDAVRYDNVHFSPAMNELRNRVLPEIREQMEKRIEELNAYLMENIQPRVDELQDSLRICQKYRLSPKISDSTTLSMYPAKKYRETHDLTIAEYRVYVSRKLHKNTFNDNNIIITWNQMSDCDPWFLSKLVLGRAWMFRVPAGQGIGVLPIDMLKLIVEYLDWAHRPDYMG